MRCAAVVAVTAVLAGCANQQVQTRGDALGIYGVITGFGSVRLNGIEVDTNSAVPVQIDGAAQSARALRPGQVASVVAETQGRAVRARRIDVWHAVSGPVEARPGDGSVLIVAGQRVQLDGGTRGDRDVRPGEWVDVSGLRQVDGTVVASRVDRRDPGWALVSGRLDRVGGAWRVGGIQVVPPREAGPDVAGAQVVMAGAYAPGLLTARSMIVQRGLPFPAGPRHFIVQAYAQPEGRQLRLGPNIVAEDLPDPRRSPPTGRPALVELRQDSSGRLRAIGFVASVTGLGGGTASTSDAPGSATDPGATAAASPGAASPGVDIGSGLGASGAAAAGGGSAAGAPGNVGGGPGGAVGSAAAGAGSGQSGGGQGGGVGASGGGGVGGAGVGGGSAGGGGAAGAGGAAGGVGGTAGGAAGAAAGAGGAAGGVGGATGGVGGAAGSAAGAAGGVGGAATGGGHGGGAVGGGSGGVGSASGAGAAGGGGQGGGGGHGGGRGGRD